MKKVIKNLDCKLFTKDDSGIQESASVEGLFLFSFLEANERNNLGMKILFSFISVFSWKPNRGLGFSWNAFKPSKLLLKILNPRNSF